MEDQLNGRPFEECLSPAGTDNERLWYEKTVQPIDSAKVWRYMDLARFVSLLETEALFFTRLDFLEDAFEGSMPRGNQSLLECHFQHHGIDDRSLLQEEEFGSWVRSFLYVNCWHRSDHESNAMWRIYAHDKSLAITTEYCNLKMPPCVKAGAVKYIDYESDTVTEPVAEFLAMHKRKSFEYEQEVRALAWGAKDEMHRHESGEDGTNYMVPLDNRRSGVFVPVDLKKFIQSIVVGPTAERWFLTTVEKLTKRYGLDVPVVTSKLSATPRFYGHWPERKC